MMTRRLKILLALLGMFAVVAMVNYLKTSFKPLAPRFPIGGHSVAHEHEHRERAHVPKKEVREPGGVEALPEEFRKPMIKLGEPTAPVEIKAYLMAMESCHKPTFDALKAVAEKFRGKVYVEVVNMETPEGQKVASKDGVHCVTVFINGKETFQLPGPKGKQKKVVLSGMVGGSFVPSDIEEIVRLELSVKKRGGKSKNKSAVIEGVGRSEPRRGCHCGKGRCS